MAHFARVRTQIASRRQRSVGHRPYRPVRERTRPRGITWIRVRLLALRLRFIKPSPGRPTPSRIHATIELVAAGVIGSTQAERVHVDGHVGNLPWSVIARIRELFPPFKLGATVTPVLPRSAAQTILPGIATVSVFAIAVLVVLDLVGGGFSRYLQAHNFAWSVLTSAALILVTYSLVERSLTRRAEKQSIMTVSRPLLAYIESVFAARAAAENYVFSMLAHDRAAILREEGIGIGSPVEDAVQARGLARAQERCREAAAAVPLRAEIVDLHRQELIDFLPAVSNLGRFVPLMVEIEESLNYAVELSKVLNENDSRCSVTFRDEDAGHVGIDIDLELEAAFEEKFQRLWKLKWLSNQLLLLTHAMLGPSRIDALYSGPDFASIGRGEPSDHEFYKYVWDQDLTNED